jgi:hypothetical protein
MRTQQAFAVSRAEAALLPAVLCALLAAAPAAHANVIGRVSQEGLEVVINDTQDGCPEGALSALWTQPDLHLKGCYIERDGVLFMVWEDGDRHVVKRSAFTARTI